MKYDRRKRELVFAAALLTVIAIFLVSVVNTNQYNAENYKKTFTGSELFVAEDPHKADVSVIAVPRGSTWTKVFDINNEGKISFFDFFEQTGIWYRCISFFRMERIG